MRLEHPVAGKAQQGAIFNCAIVPGYEGCACFGIVITARCDLEHHKHSVINYLPIVRFTDCVVRHLSVSLARRVYKDLDKKIGNSLRSKGVSEDIRKTFPLEDIVTMEFKGKDRAALLEKCHQLQMSRDLLNSTHSFEPAKARSLFALATSETPSLVEELIHQKLGEFYFLTSVDCCAPSTEGFVVLLRNMQTMDKSLMNAIVAGLTPESAKLHKGYDHFLSFKHEPICLITGVLRSPDLEHLAQQFANLFVRIGLDDHEQSTIDTHIQLAKLL